MAVVASVSTSISELVKCIELPPRIAHPAQLSPEEEEYMGLQPLDNVANAQVLSEYAGDRPDTNYEAIYCPDHDCPTGRDWLMEIPNNIAGWVCGSVAAVTALALLAATAAGRNAAFLDGVLAMFELGASLFLRAALGTNNQADMAALYKASMMLNYHAGIELSHLVAAAMIRMYVHFHAGGHRRAGYVIAAMRVLSIGFLALAVVGVVLMFDGVGTTGLRLIQALAFAVVALCLAVAAIAVGLLRQPGASLHARHFATAFWALLLLALWAAFMGSRTFLDLDNPARASEVLFYLLNYLPLFLIGAGFVVLRAPLYFNFDRASVWMDDDTRKWLL
ncbi:hypothetical protein GGF46_002455 [Coemansia sp. RSA 552]|nr:hypothetical protein GGF46_002455 [Coemansia sp. RSA 552]